MWEFIFSLNDFTRSAVAAHHNTRRKSLGTLRFFPQVVRQFPDSQRVTVDVSLEEASENGSPRTGWFPGSEKKGGRDKE
jgi:hypothetical protein